MAWGLLNWAAAAYILRLGSDRMVRSQRWYNALFFGSRCMSRLSARSAYFCDNPSDLSPVLFPGPVRFVKVVQFVRFPLRYQLLVPLLAVAIVSLTAVGGIYAMLATRQTTQRIERQLQGVARVLATSNFPLTEAVLQQMKHLSGAEFLVTDVDRVPAVASLDPLPAKLPGGAEATTFDQVELGPEVVVENQRYYHSAVSLADRAGPQRRQTLHILFPRDDYVAAWRGAFFPPLAVGTVAVVAISAMVLWIAARISRTARVLSNEVARLAQGDYSSVELPATNDELRDLAFAVNQTASQLAGYEQQVRSTEQMRTLALIGAGLAHEMRNAATGCRMAVDLHAADCPLGPEDEALGVAKRQLELMENRLQRFLSLGKRSPQVVVAPVDLGELIASVLPLVEPMARHSGVELRWTPPTRRVELLADADGLCQGILNVLLNAIEAAQTASATASHAGEVAVVLSLAGDGHTAQIAISDNGPGPDPALGERLFEAFATGKPEGVGLGLAVAQQALQSHGGDVAWRRDGARTHFLLTLPLSDREHTYG